MKRWMALDVGSRNVGVAVSDPLKLTARPLTTLKRRDLETDVEALRDLMQRHAVERLIVGLPLRLSGDRSSTLDKIEPLVKRIQETTSILVEWKDERLSTKEAEQLMKELGLSQSERRRKRNEFAAALILKWYLEEETSQRSPVVPD